MSIIKKVFQYGNHQVTLTTGQVARQATGAVVVDINDTVVLVTVVAKKEADAGRDFFPLTVNYQERFYAAGRIPGGYFKREGRPTERETLISRLIDRPIRPLFPNGFQNEVQVVATVLSLNPEVEPDIAALIGASAALAIAGVPFAGPIGAARVGYKDGKYVLNPTEVDCEAGDLNLVVAGTEAAVLMVESEAKELSEAVMLGAVMFGHEQMQTVISAINEFAAEAGKARWDWQAPASDEAVAAAIAEQYAGQIGDAYFVADKVARQQQLSEIRTAIMAQFVDAENEASPNESEIAKFISKLEKHVVRDRILQAGQRIDGRDTKTVRPIAIESSFLARVHGTSLFTRGETQALVSCTLGTARDEQMIDSPLGEQKDRFMLHYNFPPYCVGEAGMMTGPKRREIGHGRLAKRAVQAVLPSLEDFPYTLRLVSEITESNGSSSMASVCGSSLALMDAGVPIKSHVAGIAMGLIKDQDNFAVLTDILGDEDHLGDMDFKVAGTRDGVTALQMDIKIDGITREIMTTALDQAKAGREHILGLMEQALNQPRDLSNYAPRIMTINIHPDKIRDVIGKGGATIRSLTEETGTTIDITDDGVVKIYAVDGHSAQSAKHQIEQLTAEVEVGKIYHGKIVKIMDFGAFVNILPGKEGLVHISQICNRRLESVEEVLSEGEEVTVKAVEIDRQGRVRLSMKVLPDNPLDQ